MIEALEARRLLSGDAAVAKAEFVDSAGAAEIAVADESVSIADKVAAFESAGTDFLEYVDLGAVDASQLTSTVDSLQDAAQDLLLQFGSAGVSDSVVVAFSDTFITTVQTSVLFNQIASGGSGDGPTTQPGGDGDGGATTQPGGGGGGGGGAATQPGGGAPGPAGGNPGGPDPDGNGVSGDLNGDGVIDGEDIVDGIGGVAKNWDKPGPLGRDFWIRRLKSAIDDYLAQPKKQPPGQGGPGEGDLV